MILVNLGTLPFFVYNEIQCDNVFPPFRTGVMCFECFSLPWIPFTPWFPQFGLSVCEYSWWLLRWCAFFLLDVSGLFCCIVYTFDPSVRSTDLCLLAIDYNFFNTSTNNPIKNNQFLAQQLMAVFSFPPPAKFYDKSFVHIVRLLWKLTWRTTKAMANIFDLHTLTCKTPRYTIKLMIMWGGRGGKEKEPNWSCKL